MNYILAFLLSIPFINLLVGIYVGIMMLAKLLVSEEWRALLFSLLLAAIWCCLGIGTMFAGNSAQTGEMRLLVAGGFWLAHLLFSFWMLNWVDKVFVRKITVQIAKLHMEFEGKADFSQMFGSGLGTHLAYDADQKLIAFVDGNGFSVKPFSYVRSHELEWITESNGTKVTDKKIRLKISTSDLERAIVAIPLASKAQGDDLMARLNILLAK